MNDKERLQIKQELTAAGFDRISSELGLQQGKHVGSEYLARCPHPLHEDKNPSFRLYIKNGTMFGTCYSKKCYNHTNVLDLIIKVTGYGFKETLQHLSNSGLISTPKISNKLKDLGQGCKNSSQPIPKPTQKKKSPCKPFMGSQEMLRVWQACKKMQSYLNKEKGSFPARDYLVKRGIWKAANVAGLCYWSGRLPIGLQHLFHSTLYIWQGRQGVLIPVWQDASPIALQLRLFTPYNGVKYFLPKGTPASKIVWNTDALQEIKPDTTVIICESIIDGLSAQTLWSDACVLSVFSASFAKALVQVIPSVRRVNPMRVVLAGDADPAGQKFNKEVIGMLIKNGFSYDKLQTYNFSRYGVKDMNELLLKERG